jgi:DNA uptake protein ComE-like DNA-binding protein
VDHDMDGPFQKDFHKDVPDGFQGDGRPGPRMDGEPEARRHPSGHPTSPHRRPPNMPQGRPPVPGWRPPYPTPPVPPPPPVAMPVPPPSEPRGIMWSFVPFLTFGLGTPFSFMYAAVCRQSLSLGTAAAGYGAGTVAWMLLAGTGQPALAVLSAIMMMTLWVASSVHAFVVRPSVFPREAPHNARNAHAIKFAKYRRTLREEARALAAEDPALAHELRIGRPDLPRGYDDGGLIDVNHAPAETLSMLPGVDEEIVSRIVRRRTEQGGFISAEELAVDVDLPPALLPQLSEYAVFLP